MSSIIPFTLYAVFEREPQINARPNEMIFGPYHFIEDADLLRIKHFGEHSNYYTAELDKNFISPKEL